MISAKLLKNSDRIRLRLNGTTEHIYGQVSKSELQNRIQIAQDLEEACKTCKMRLNLPVDKFEKNYKFN